MRDAVHVALHVAPLQRQQLAQTTASRQCRNQQAAQVRRRDFHQPLFFPRLQAPGAHGFGRAVEPHDVHAVALERCVVSVALRNRPVEQMAHACLEPIEADLAAFGAATGEGGARQQVRWHVTLLGPQHRDLSRSSKRGVHRIEARAEHGVEISSRDGPERHRAECRAGASGHVDGGLQQQPHMDLELAHRMRLACVAPRVVAQGAIRDVCQGGLSSRQHADRQRRTRASAHVRSNAIGQGLCLGARHDVADRPIRDAMKTHAVAHSPTRDVLAVTEGEVPWMRALRPQSGRTAAPLREPVLASHRFSQKCAGARPKSSTFMKPVVLRCREVAVKPRVDPLALEPQRPTAAHAHVAKPGALDCATNGRFRDARMDRGVAAGPPPAWCRYRHSWLPGTSSQGHPWVHGQRPVASSSAHRPEARCDRRGTARGSVAESCALY